MLENTETNIVTSQSIKSMQIQVTFLYLRNEVEEKDT